MPTAKKLEKVAELKELFQRTNTFFVTDYQGLTVADMTALRSQLRNSDARYLVEKNTLVKVAIKDLGIEGLDEHLTGPTALAFTFGDPVAPAKALKDFYKAKERPVVKIFSLDGELMDGSKLGTLADLPSRDELLAQVIGVIEGPISEILSTLDSVTQEFIGTVDALAEAGEAKAA